MILISFLALVSPPKHVKAQSTIHVDDNNTLGPWDGTQQHPYRNVTSALAHATTGDTINAHNGTYYENLLINKTVSIIGEDRNATVIDGKGAGIVVGILADGVVLRSCTVRNSGTWDLGIVVGKVSNVTIEENMINNTGGIFLSLSNRSTVNENIISHNWFGIRLLMSDGNSLTSNVIENNHEGITLYDVSNSIIRNNTLSDNVYNLDISGEHLSHYMNSIDSTNTINGKNVCCITNREDIIINSSTFPNIGYLGIVNSTRIKIENVNLTDNKQGILLAFTSNSTIENALLTRNWVGIELVSSERNRIEGCRIENSTCGLSITGSYNNITSNEIAHNSDGIYIASDGSTLYRNRIRDNGYRGIYLIGSNNSIYENSIVDNAIGLVMDFYGNRIYHNNFINNSKQAELNVQRALGIWDDGYSSGGNYWSDYNGTDLGRTRDGLGDTAYNIAANNTDRYPLMGMFTDFNVTSVLHVQTICDSAITNFRFNGSAIVFNVSGQNGTEGFCRICIPALLMNGLFKVFVNGTEVSHLAYLPYSNSTHNYLYFAYNHSEQEVVIVPEFWSSVISIVLTAAAALSAIIGRKGPQRRLLVKR